MREAKLANEVNKKLVSVVYPHCQWLMIDSYSICLVCVYSQLPLCVHLAKTDIPIIQTAAKSQAKVNHRCLTEITPAIMDSC